MPRRNLILIFAAAIMALAFHSKARQNRYAAPFSEAIDLINRGYIQDVDDRALYEAAMNGMMAKLDEHSSYLNPEEYTSMLQTSIELEFEGIGATLELSQAESPNDIRELTIVMPILDGPADKAGIKSGDVILEINGVSAAGLTTKEAVELIKGPAGTKVTLKLRREGSEEPIEIAVERGKVVVDSVVGLTRQSDGRWDYFIEGEPSIKYLRLTTFATHTAEELARRIGDFQREGKIEGLVLDLRDNLGGRLDAAIAVSDLLLAGGEEIVTIRDRNSRIRDRFVADSSDSLGNFPLAVLINGNTASASEITAACLQDNARAVIIGTQSYGKGTVQDLIPLEHGRSRLKLTTATYWRPSGKNIHKTKANESNLLAWGVRPTKGYEVPLTRQQEIAMIRDRNERDRPRSTKPADAKKPQPIVAPEPDSTVLDVDPQLRRAVEFLRNKEWKN